MNEQIVPDREQDAEERPQPALIAAVLLFVVLWVVGIAMGIAELSQRDVTAQAEPHNGTRPV